MYLKSIKINTYEYFNNLQKKENLKNWTNYEWKKYLSEINIATKDSNENFNFSNNAHSSNININFKYEYKNNKHNMYLIANSKNNIYKNNQWTYENNVENQEIIKEYNLKPISFELLNNNLDLYEFLNKNIY